MVPLLDLPLWIRPCIDVTHLDETSHMSAEFVFRYGPKCMGGLIITDSCFIAFITSKICYLSYGQVSHMKYVFKYTKKAVFRSR